MNVLSKLGLFGAAFAALAGCNDAAAPGAEAPEAGEETMLQIAASPGDVVLSCVYEQDGSGRIELVATAGGYEAVTYTVEYDPWDCRCEIETRNVLGTYAVCNASANDSRVVSCYTLASPNTVGNFIFTSSKVTTTQIAIGSPLEVSRDELAVAIIDTKASPPRQDLVYGLHECQGFLERPPGHFATNEGEAL